MKNNSKTKNMKKVLLLSMFAVCLSCKKEADFTKVKVGMKSADLINVVGEPNQKQDLPLVGAYWTYDKYLVVIQSDTVNEFLTNEDYQKRLKEVNEGIENLKKSLQ